MQMLTGIYIQPDALKPYFEKMHWWYKPLYPAAYNESRIMIRLNAFFMVFSMGHYMVHALFMSFLAFFGSISSYKPNGPEINGCDEGAFITGFITGLAISSVLVFRYVERGVGIVCAGRSLLPGIPSLTMATVSYKKWLLLSGFLLLLGISRPYLLPCLLPGIVCILIARQQQNNAKVLLICGIVNALYLLVLFNLFRFGHALDLVYQLCYKRGEFYIPGRTNKGGQPAFQ